MRSLARNLVPIEFAQGQTLIAAGTPSLDLFFIESGLVSIVTTMHNGRTVEVAIVGSDGIVGIPALLGTISMPNRAFVQVAGNGYRIAPGDTQGILHKKETRLREKSLQFLQGYLVQASQTAACNRLHDISERLARWLLLCHDRVEHEQIDITQKTLSDMLGAPRATVTLAAGILKRNGSIQYTKGKLRVSDRDALEKAACECYSAITNEYRRLGLL